jgi:hypothetical protein
MKQTCRIGHKAYGRVASFSHFRPYVKTTN